MIGRSEVTKAYRSVFTSEAGRVILKDLMRVYHLVHPITSRNDAHRVQLEAERNVVFYIMKRASLDESLLENFLMELQEEKKRELPSIEDATSPKDSNHEPDGISLNDQNPRLLGII